MTTSASNALMMEAGRYRPLGSFIATISPVSISETIQAAATTSLSTLNPSGRVVPQGSSLSTGGNGVGEACPGARRSEVVVAFSGRSECGHLSVSGAAVRVVVGAVGVSASASGGPLASTAAREQARILFMT